MIEPKATIQSGLSSPAITTFSKDSSITSVEEIPVDSENESSPVHGYVSYSIEDHLSTLRNLSANDLSNEEAILALPRRRNKSQRPLATQLAQALYPDLPGISALTNYDRLTTASKALVRERKRARLAVQLQPKNNSGGKLLRVQGPWAGQQLDPVDLKGPAAIPMPVKIGSAEDFEPIFRFLSQNLEVIRQETSDSNSESAAPEGFTGTPGFELTWKAPLLEFERGIVYEDGRLDLCKQVVGPTHIGKLMGSLESNTQIRHFLLGNNAISTTGAKEIAGFIQRHPDRIETWYLAGCHITRHGLSLLVPHMTASSSITNLWFKRNPLGSDSSGLLAELVLQTPHLRTLDLETTELGDEGTRRFIDAITGHPTSLRHLYLNANGIGQKACASLAKYLADPNCILESLFLSTNPIGDAGMLLLAPGLAKNKTLKRLTCASAGLTSKGVACLAKALCGTGPQLQALVLGASQTTKAHGQKFNYLDDDCIGDLEALVLSPSMRLLELGRTLFTEAGIQKIRSTAAQSELVFLDVHRVHVADKKTDTIAQTDLYDGNSVPKSCSLEVRHRLAANQAKHFPRSKSYDDFLVSEDLRFLRNTSDVRKIDSMYRTRDKRLGLPMDAVWENGDPTWKLITEDAEMAEG
ncbi:leucine rich repeat protein [Phlyctema vagabunda]|uniref:Leucine rich repeat protein n=1 Tax=Phlyctema vagabunda TaxID=108571 RepID=A0ABR4P893_9HELO